MALGREAAGQSDLGRLFARPKQRSGSVNALIYDVAMHRRTKSGPEARREVAGAHAGNAGQGNDYTDAGEAKRQAVNAWVRSNTGVDGIFDFDKAVQDSADPLQIDATSDSGDHIHMNDTGYGRMAAAVDLSKF